MTRRNQIYFFAAILAMLAGLAHGQVPTGNIPAGVYTLNGDQFVKNANMIGQGDVTIRGTGRLYIQNDANLTTITVKGITFDGVQLIPDKSAGGMNTNITIDNNTFTNGSNITWNVGLANSRITNNTVTGESKGGYWLFGLNYNGLAVTNNKLTDIRSGIHVDAIGAGRHLLVEQNVVDGYCGIAFEFQSAADGVVVQDNYAVRPNAKYGAVHVGAFSCILSRSANIKILRNTVKGLPSGGEQQIPRYCFEIGGDNSLSSDNFIDGGFDAFVDNDREGTHSTTVIGNRYANVGKNPPITATSHSNNGPGVVLSWNVNRELPGPNKRLGSPPSTAPTTSLSDYNAMKSDRDRLRTRLDSISVEAAKP